MTATQTAGDVRLPKDFRLVQCETIEDIAYALPARVLGDVELETGFTVESGYVTFAGRGAAKPRNRYNAHVATGE